jgi:hypothetical protein
MNFTSRHNCTPGPALPVSNGFPSHQRAHGLHLRHRSSALMLSSILTRRVNHLYIAVSSWFPSRCGISGPYCNSSIKGLKCLFHITSFSASHPPSMHRSHFCAVPSKELHLDDSSRTTEGDNNSVDTLLNSATTLLRMSREGM